MKCTIKCSGYARKADYWAAHFLIVDSRLLIIDCYRWELDIYAGRASAARIVPHDAPSKHPHRQYASWVLANLYACLGHGDLSEERRRARIIEAARLMAQVAEEFDPIAARRMEQAQRFAADRADRKVIQ
jgi:hypothetical protein